MSQLLSLRMSKNRVDEQARKYLFPAITMTSSLGSLSGLEGGTLGVFFDYIVAKVESVQKHIPIPSHEFIKELDLSHAQLETFPMVLLELKALVSLDLSFNELYQLPYIEVCDTLTVKYTIARGATTPRYFWLRYSFNNKALAMVPNSTIFSQGTSVQTFFTGWNNYKFTPAANVAETNLVLYCEKHEHGKFQTDYFRFLSFDKCNGIRCTEYLFQ